MAKLIINGKEEEIQDGEEIAETCDQHEVLFGCCSGVCGSCKIKVIEGMENLSDKVEEEDSFCEEPNERLACQCKIKQGIVKIERIDYD
ncbi:MAG: 2Fe-2S iron-sulfur cluster binding domain-containing protein [Candidatus Woesearchaeota archaeon]